MSIPQQATKIVRSGIESDTQHHAVIPPIYLSSNFAFEASASPANTITPASAIRPATCSAKPWRNWNRAMARW